MFTREADFYDPMEMYRPMPVIPQRPLQPMSNSMMREHSERQEKDIPSTTATPDLKIQQCPPCPPCQPIQNDLNYTQGWLRTKIGYYIKVEFLIGTSMLIDREGILTTVGISYIVLRESGSNDELMCDMYSIKFVRVYDNQAKAKMCK